MAIKIQQVEGKRKEEEYNRGNNDLIFFKLGEKNLLKKP